MRSLQYLNAKALMPFVLQYSTSESLLRRTRPPLTLNRVKYCSELNRTSTDDRSIEDRVALVLGGEENGVSLECARQLLNCGAKGVLLAGTCELKGRQALGQLAVTFSAQKAAFLRVNLTDPLLLRHAFESVNRHFGCLDIVVNNVQFNAPDWDQQIDTEIKGLIGADLLGLEFMGQHNGHQGGVIANVIHPYSEKNDLYPVNSAIAHFAHNFNSTLATTYYTCTGVKLVSICCPYEVVNEDRDCYVKNMVNTLMRAILNEANASICSVKTSTSDSAVVKDSCS